MRRSLPPYPQGGDWTEWAGRLLEYLQDRDKATSESLPQALQLLHQTTSQTERAGVPGVLMFDPVANVPIFSNGTSWQQFGGGGGTGGLPPGGTEGQVLAKQSSTDQDADWEDIIFDGGSA